MLNYTDFKKKALKSSLTFAPLPDFSTLDKEGFELHENDIPIEELNSIDFRNFKDVVTR